METYWLTGVANCAGNAIPGRHKANQDTLTVPGQYPSRSSLLSDLAMMTSPELICKCHKRTGSAKSVQTMQRAGSFRQRERTKSTSITTSSKSSESLAAACQSRLSETVPMITVSYNEQTTLIGRDDTGVITSPVAIQVDECY